MMDMKNEAFLKRLLETFAQEAKEHIDNLSEGLLNLKKSGDAELSKTIVETLFREAHSFKGAARAVNFLEVEELCKAMEDVFNHAKQTGEKIPNPLIEVMLECNDMLSVISTLKEERRRDFKPKVQELIEALHAKPQRKKIATLTTKEPLKEIVQEVLQEEVKEALAEVPLASKEEILESPIKTEETIRIPVKKLNAIMRQSEEMLFAKMVAKRHVDELVTIGDEITELIKTLKNVTHEEALKRLSAAESLINKSIKKTKGDAREITLMVERLIEDMKEALMLPFSTIFSTLPKILHDMAKSVGKEISLNMVGGEAEIDKRISEQMHDPIIHLLRNSVDHGIESQGTITLTLTQKSASKIELSISDDGIGIDAQKIRQSAVKKGVITQENADLLDEEGAINLIFLSGVSTAKVVTDLSGRGLGLAIVREKSEQLGGQAHVANNKDKGCSFTMTLPLSLSTFRGVITSFAQRKYIFASERIARVMTIEKKNVKNIEGKEMVVVEGRVVPFYHLSNILGLALEQNDSADIAVVVITFGDETLAVGVDSVEYEEEVMVKSLGKQLERVQNVAGATMLASDVPALILNVSDIFKSVGSVSLKTVAPQKDVLKRKAKILVVDDSPTTRALLQNILEMVGYDVVAAVDGMDAFETLKKESFDLVVSDVDMPKMNGFELTESIRKDPKTSDLPVILVTSLESDSDKEKGMNAGANAYLVKSAFDQNNLIDNIQSLID